MSHRSRARMLSALASLVAACLALPAAHTQERAQVRAQEHSLGAVAWFQGCWERSGQGGRRTVERWQAPASGEMKGASRSFAGVTETAGERLRIVVEAGRLTYHAHPSTQAAQSFTATTVSVNAITFENLAHDFPQRIVYERRGTDSLVARIEGDRAGRRPPITFAFRSIDCAGQGDSPADIAESALAPSYADLGARLRAHPQGTPGWFVAHAAPGFSYVNFAAPGYQGRAGSLSTQEAAARAVAAAAATLPSDYTASVAIAAVLARGDTAEVMAVTRLSARTGPEGQQRVRSSEQRRVDRWVRGANGWRLVAATLVDDETWLDGVLSAKNGVPVVPPR